MDQPPPALPRQRPQQTTHVPQSKTKRFSRFANASHKKYWDSAYTRGRPEKLPKWKDLPAWKASVGYDNLRFVRKIAVDRQIHGSDLPATSCGLETGDRRLQTLNATLMVVAGVSRLHYCAGTDWKHLCDLIFVIGLGLPVVVGSAWLAAAGQPARLAAQGRGGGGIFLHAPAAQTKPCKLVLGRALVEAHPGLQFALQHCAEQAGSKWTVVKDTVAGRALAANQVRATSISQLAAAILPLRTLQADSSRRYKLGLT